MASSRTSLTTVKSVVSDPELVAKRRAQITKVATTLFASRGFHGTTVKDIAKIADVSPGLIYQYFEEKHDILFLSIMDVIAQKLERLQAVNEQYDDPVERFRAIITEYIRINDENCQAVILIYREIQCLPRNYIAALQELEVKTAAVIAQAVSFGIAAGRFKDEDPDFIAHVIVSLAQAWATKSWRLKKKSSLDRYIADCTTMLLDSLRS